MTTSPSIEPTGVVGRLRARAPYWLGQAALWLGLWLAAIRFPAPPTPGLDPSWRLVLGHALENQLQFGVDLVFTYGPLGFLLASTNDGLHYEALLAWQLVATAAFVTVIWLFGRSFRGWRLVVYYLYFAFLGLGYPDALHMSVILLFSAALLRDPVAARRGLAGALAAGLAVLALIKFTNLMLAGFAIGCVVLHHAWRRRWTDLLVAGLAFAVVFLAGWMLCGQRLAHLPAFVFNSLNASSGYSDGMSVYETGLVLACGLGAAAALAAYYLLTLWRRPDFPRALALIAIAAAASFMNWKHGYVRADGHVFAHYISCLLIVICYPVLLQDDSSRARLKAALLALVAGFSLAGAYAASPVSLTDAPAIWNYHVKTNVNHLRLLRDLPRNAAQEWRRTADSHRLTGVATLVGRDAVDLLGNDQAYLLFTGLNYTPRPVFQAYFTYTGHLQRLNEEFFRSERAPKFVLQRMDTIDHRLPALDDARSTRHLYRHYDFLTNEGGFLVWRKKGRPPEPENPTPLAPVTAAFAEPIAVPEDGDRAIWVEVDLRPTWLGRIRGFLYKPPLVHLNLTDANGLSTRYRLVQQMARSGFLLHPHFVSGQNIEDYERGADATRVTSLTLELPPSARKYFKAAVPVRFTSLAPFPRAPKSPPETMRARFRVFNRIPDADNALYPANVLADDGMEMLFAHPPSTLEFKLDDEPASRVAGRFGLASKAYTPPNATDGAGFVVDWTGPDGKVRVLFERLLRPVNEPNDRGPQSFDVAIPPGPGVLKLRINSGPDNNMSYDWAYWTDVVFSP